MWRNQGGSPLAVQSLGRQCSHCRPNVLLRTMKSWSELLFLPLPRIDFSARAPFIMQAIPSCGARVTMRRHIDRSRHSSRNRPFPTSLRPTNMNRNSIGCSPTGSRQFFVSVAFLRIVKWSFWRQTIISFCCGKAGWVERSEPHRENTPEKRRYLTQVFPQD